MTVTPPSAQDVAIEILDEGTIDWVSMVSAYGCFFDLDESGVQAGPIVGEALRQLLQAGYLEIGRLSPRFVASEGTISDAIAQVAAYTRDNPDETGDDGYDIWFNLTPAGERRAAELASIRETTVWRSQPDIAATIATAERELTAGATTTGSDLLAVFGELPNREAWLTGLKTKASHVSVGAPYQVEIATAVRHEIDGLPAHPAMQVVDFLTTELVYRPHWRSIPLAGDLDGYRSAPSYQVLLRVDDGTRTVLVIAIDIDDELLEP